jgi:glycosyltransferase involved in cell wall biosynthesis
MRICLDTSTLRVRHAGIAVYTLELTNALLGLVGPEDSLVSFDGMGGFLPIDAEWPARKVVENEARARDYASAGMTPSNVLERVMRAGTWGRRVARFAKEMRFALGASHYDLCHAVVTIPPGPTKKPVIPLVYDVSMQRFPETHPKERVQAFERFWPEISRAPFINTISDFSRREIVEVLGYSYERIVVTYPGVASFYFENDQANDEALLKKFDLMDRRLILLVGTQEPRKNISVALSAFAALPASTRDNSLLVVAGGSGWGNLVAPPGVEPLIRNGAIRFTGYVSRAELRALYRRASVLVFPSIYEGFGIPAAEALACGTPVAVSIGNSLEEVVGPHGTLIASGDIDAWRESMLAAILSPMPTLEERTARRKWAHNFDWKMTAEQTLAMYRKVLLA